jgi:hypothetical protein
VWEPEWVGSAVPAARPTGGGFPLTARGTPTPMRDSRASCHYDAVLDPPPLASEARRPRTPGPPTIDEHRHRRSLRCACDSGVRLVSKPRVTRPRASDHDARMLTHPTRAPLIQRLRESRAKLPAIDARISALAAMSSGGVKSSAPFAPDRLLASERVAQHLPITRTEDEGRFLQRATPRRLLLRIPRAPSRCDSSSEGCRIGIARGHGGPR